MTPKMFQDFEMYQHYIHVFGIYTGFFSKYTFYQVKKHAPYFARCCPLFCSVLPHIFQFQPLIDYWPLCFIAPIFLHEILTNVIEILIIYCIKWTGVGCVTPLQFF